MRINKLTLIIAISFLQIDFCYCQNAVPTLLTDSFCVNCDTSINSKLFLNNEKSIIKNMDINFNKHTKESTIGLTKTFPSLFYKSNNGKEYLKIVNYAGGNESGCSYFEVGYLQNMATEKFVGKSKDKNFITESGIKLGMSFSDFFIMKGKGYKLFSLADGVSTYFYHYGHATYQTQITIDDPIYIAIYKFKKDKLISFGFGYLPIIPD